MSCNIRSIDFSYFESNISKCINIISSASDKVSVYHSELLKFTDLHAALCSMSVTNQLSSLWMTSELESATAER